MNQSKKIQKNEKIKKNDITFTRKLEVSKEKIKENKKISYNITYHKNPGKIAVNSEYNLTSLNNTIKNKDTLTPKQSEGNKINLAKKSSDIKHALLTEIVNLNEGNQNRNKNQIFNNTGIIKASQSNSILTNSINIKSSLSQTKTNALKTSVDKDNTIKKNPLIRKPIKEVKNSFMQTLNSKSKSRDKSNKLSNKTKKFQNNLEHDKSSERKITETHYTISHSKDKKGYPKSGIKTNLLEKSKDANITKENLMKNINPSKVSTKSNSNSIKKDYASNLVPLRNNFGKNVSSTLGRSKEKSTDHSTNMITINNKSSKGLINNLTKNKDIHSSEINDIHSKTISISSSNTNFKNISHYEDKISIKIELDQVLTLYSKILSMDEIEELKSMNDIFYLGNLPERLNKFYSLDRLNGGESNGGSIKNESNLYEENSKIDNKDDENCHYQSEKGDQIIYRYEIIRELGRGSFGRALKCLDHKYNKECCIKIIKNNKKFISQAKIEIKLLKYIRKADPKKEANIVKVYDSFIFRNHICIVFELLDCNLYEFLKNQNFKGMDLSVVRKIALQLLYTLIFLKKHSIIHCDLKLENILLRKNGKTGIKVIDFGSSCFENEKLYSYIQSRFYRAPEIILMNGYGVEIDMWSFGCIMAELYAGIPIFPGENERDQLNYIMEYLGVPSNNLLSCSKNRNNFFDEKNIPFQIPNSRGKIRYPSTKKIDKFLRGSDENFINFVSKCLVFDVKKRITPEEAILHPWIISGIPKEILSFHKSLIEQNRINEKDIKNAHSVDKVKPISEIVKNSKSIFNNYNSNSKNVVTNKFGNNLKEYSQKKNKSENSFGNTTN